MTAGSIISHYRILEKIGQGGMGVVYKAEDLRLNRPVALKFLPADAVSGDAKLRFLHEAQATALIHHPNICPIYDVDEVDGQLFLAMAYLEGRTIAQMLAEGPVTVDFALDLASQVAEGLKAAHEHGVIHRDIKSNNIVVNNKGTACILDFGLALRSGSTRITVVGSAIGTPAYMSPEQAQGLDVDHRTDLWSLGVVLFEMLTRKHPFRREKDIAVLHGIVNDPTPLVSATRPEVRPEIEAVIAKALAKSPQLRFQSAEEMAAELRRVRSIPESATRTFVQVPTPASGIEKPGKLRKIGFWSGIAATAVFTLVAFFNVHRPPLPEDKQVAVLPFENIGGEEMTRTIADGLTETLTSDLTQMEQVQGKMMVVPASEIRSRKINSAEDAHRIYGVNLVITGSAQRLGDRIQFTLNLVDAAKLRQIRSGSFDFDAKNPITMRDSAMNALIGLLQVDLSAAERKSVAQPETSSGDAYSEYLKGRGYLARYDVKGNIDRALASFQKASQQDPKYALAYAGLGEAYWWKAKGSSDKQWADLARTNAERAVQLDPNLVVARVKLGQIYSESGRREDAIRELQKALQMAPGSADTYRALAAVYTDLGRYPEAETAYLEATRRRPTDWLGHLLLGLYYSQRGRFAEAESALKAAQKLTPDNEVVSRNLAGVYMRQGRYKDAREQLQKTLKIMPSARAYGALMGAYYYEGRFDEAAAAMEAGIDLDSTNYSLYGNLGSAYRWSKGNEGKAEAAFRRAIELGQKALEVTPKDDNIRANLAEYWAKLGQRNKALDQLEQIPVEVRGKYAGRIAVVYELTGQRRKAIETATQLANDSVLLNEMKNEPELRGLWSDASFQAAIQKRGK